jgi:hypothetical protein
MMVRMSSNGKDASRNSRKRDELEIARDRALVAEYRLKGLSYRQIADELNNRPGIFYTVSDTTVQRDYQANIAMWNERAMEPTGADRREQLIRLEMVEAEAWAAWEQSKKPAEQTKEVERLRDLYDENGDVYDQAVLLESVERISRGQVGNERYLRIILDCWDKRSRLKGLYEDRVKIEADIREERTLNVKMYHGVAPNLWDDPSIEVIGKTIYKNGRPIEIIDGVPVPLEDPSERNNTST